MVVAYGRLSFLNPDNARQILRRAIIECKKKYPFNIEARVLSPTIYIASGNYLIMIKIILDAGL